MFAVLSTTPGRSYAQETHVPLEVLVRQVDHITLNADEPEQLFRLFTETLGLPVDAPWRSLQVATNRTISVGSVGFDSIYVELGHVQDRPPGLMGVGLEPGGSVSDVVAGLDAQGLKHGAPALHYAIDSSGTIKDSSGKPELAYTTVSMTSLLPGEIFFCQYDAAHMLSRYGAADAGARRARFQRDLQNHGGGPLGIQSIVELGIGVSDITAAKRDWRILLGPPQAGEEFVWQLGAGPAIRLVAAPEDHLVLLRMKVKSLERARAFLKRENLLGLDTGHELALERSRVGPADIRFVE